MKLFNLFRKSNNTLQEVNNTSVIPDIEDVHLLSELANDEHTYWKFSQSQKGRSIENVYAKYLPGEIVCAEDKDKLLSFVNEKTIAKCYMYGDTLTKFCFDKNDNKFMEICNDEYRYIGGGLGEYETSRLLVEKNYSLENIDTLIMIIKMADAVTFMSFYFDMFGMNFEGRLRSYGYNKSADFMSYLQKKYNMNSITEIKSLMDSIDDILQEYRESIDE